MEKYIKINNKEDIYSYVNFLLVRFCMPTLCKIKPSTLINVNKQYIENIVSFYSFLELEIMQSNCSYFVLFENETMLLLLIYHQDLLSRVLSCDPVRVFFDVNQYDKENLSITDYLKNCKKRYEDYWYYGGAFPHEVGIFLGYPLADVEDFIKNKGKNYLLCGTWKVYHEKEKAQKTFYMYRKLTENAMKMLLEGKKLNDIISNSITS